MKIRKPKFDSEGYQVNIEDLNGEPLPDLSKVKIISREKAGLPPAAAFRSAVKVLKPQIPASYIKARKQAGLTQNEFAEMLGVAVGTYRQWEHGRRTPSGPAVSLLSLIAAHPELVLELRRKAGTLS
ncbi:MAG TPA: helix-turn-helix domain-containing protein [Chthoniobacterales bacterium]